MMLFGRFARFWGARLLAAGGLLGALAACRPDAPPADAVEASAYEGPLLSFQNIETIYSNRGEAKLILQAPLQYRLQNGDEVFPQGVHIDIYDDDGRHKTMLLADSAHYVSADRLYLMVGNVQVTNLLQQQRLETPLLHWDERFREIYTDTVVHITTPQEEIDGVGLRAKQDFSQYKIMKPVGVITPRKQ
jgi:LPS export ABC transporter protein LptC